MAVNVFVYFKARRVDAPAVRDALQAVRAALPDDLAAAARFGLRTDSAPLAEAPLDTWLEHYRLPDRQALPRLLGRLDALVCDSGLAALLVDRRHIEQFDELVWPDQCA